ncbi:carboxymuconolactone decarboxylase family protein [Bacillus sp. CGMCC 1.16541]|uniref:carboxymuconolactone decarboxylase family protein n=1 Tax=Bacillus sp. CGMCC 1.16541 TaxID=2185143 RepID=UPI000D731241|nr:carboxymuconolactone decarboxylase family protein [Bacillus sp. CGMCC 1.16541]
MYTKENMKRLKEVEALAPAQMQGFVAFSKGVLHDGVLTRKEKEIIAIAVAHATECPYCIYTHTKKAKEAGATKQELAEAVMVTAAIEAGGAFTHSTHAKAAYEGSEAATLYPRTNLNKLSYLQEHAPTAFAAAQQFFSAAFQPGALTVKLKELCAVAVAHTSECPYCIELHTKGAKQAGATEAELGEAIFVASLLRAGGAYTHLALMLEAYDE